MAAEIHLPMGKSMGKGGKTGQEDGKNANFRSLAGRKVPRRKTSLAHAQGQEKAPMSWADWKAFPNGLT
jgi:hypothetical protein